MRKQKWSLAALQLFAEGGAENGAAGESAADAGQQKTGETDGKFRNVVFGRPPAAQVPDAQEQQQAAEKEANPEAEFDRLVKGKFKDVYGKRVSSIVRERLKGSKETLDRYDALTPARMALAKRHGVDPNDAKALSDAILNEEALERGVSAEEIRGEWEREAKLRRLDRLEAEHKARADVDRWIGEAEAAKELYPNLNLNEEIGNEAFTGYLQKGLSVQDAYLLTHSGEIIPAAMQEAAEKGKAMAAAAVAAGQTRPREGGAGNTQGVVYKNDPNTWTDEEFDEVKRRVQAGARIVL